MTRFQFNEECAKRYIDPQLALDNDAVVEALQNRDDEAVIVALDNEF